jgi:hypothetical protein
MRTSSENCIASRGALHQIKALAAPPGLGARSLKVFFACSSSQVENAWTLELFRHPPRCAGTFILPTAKQTGAAAIKEPGFYRALRFACSMSVSLRPRLTLRRARYSIERDRPWRIGEELLSRSVRSVKPSGFAPLRRTGGGKALFRQAHSPTISQTLSSASARSSSPPPNHCWRVRLCGDPECERAEGQLVEGHAKAEKDCANRHESFTTYHHQPCGP